MPVLACQVSLDPIISVPYSLFDVKSFSAKRNYLLGLLKVPG